MEPADIQWTWPPTKPVSKPIYQTRAKRVTRALAGVAARESGRRDIPPIWWRIDPQHARKFDVRENSASAWSASDQVLRKFLAMQSWIRRRPDFDIVENNAEDCLRAQTAYARQRTRWTSEARYPAAVGTQGAPAKLAPAYRRRAAGRAQPLGTSEPQRTTPNRAHAGGKACNSGAISARRRCQIDHARIAPFHAHSTIYAA